MTTFSGTSNDQGTAPGWRVGREGRDGMWYEERHDGVWQRIEVQGEMLMGRAHHVIYFDSIERWRQHPAWARERRDDHLRSDFARNACDSHLGLLRSAATGPQALLS